MQHTHHVCADVSEGVGCIQDTTWLPGQLPSLYVMQLIPKQEQTAHSTTNTAHHVAHLWLCARRRKCPVS
jgi:hypothetical protein